MTTQELKELDTWIDLNLFSMKTRFPLRYTTDPACAMNVLKKCSRGARIGIDIDPLSGMFGVFTLPNQSGTEIGIVSLESTLELAICQFAKQLFSKEDK